MMKTAHITQLFLPHDEVCLVIARLCKSRGNLFHFSLHCEHSEAIWPFIHEILKSKNRLIQTSLG